MKIRLSPRATLALAWGVFLLYAYPGYVPPEGADMLVDSRVGITTDWHSPVMTAIWQLIEQGMAGPPGLLLVQSGMLLYGTYVLARRAVAARTAALVAGGVLLFPPILAAVAVLSAEVLLASFLVAGIAALTSSCRYWRLGGLGLLVLASGLVGAAPLAGFVIVVSLFVWPAYDRGWRRWSVATAAGVLVVLAGIGLRTGLVDARTHRVEIVRAMEDITGTLAYADDLDDAAARPLLATVALTVDSELQSHARKQYRRASRGRGLFVWPETAEQQRELLRARRELIASYRVAYLRHRALQLYRALGLPPTRRPTPIYTSFVPSIESAASMQYLARHSLLQQSLVDAVEAISGTFLFRPYLYAGLALIMVPLAIRRRRWLALVLVGSAAAYALLFAIFATREEYRDLHWLVVATVLAGLSVLPRSTSAPP